jgi:hypothetical protein
VRGRATGPDDVAHADRGCRTPREHWGSVDVSSGAAGAKVPIELLGLLKGKESRCGGYGGAHARYRHAARYVCQALQTRSESDFHPPGSSAWSNRKPFPVTAACEGSRPERE